MSADEVFDLANDFGKASTKVAAALFEDFRDEGDKFADDWRDIARGTAGAHGKHYPDAISSEPKLGLGIAVEIGPESGMPQGGMGPGFEFGSRNQPPHLDGLRALGPADLRLMRRTEKTIGDLTP